MHQRRHLLTYSTNNYHTSTLLQGSMLQAGDIGINKINMVPVLYRLILLRDDISTNYVNRCIQIVISTLWEICWK